MHGHIFNTMRVIEPLMRGLISKERIDHYIHMIESHHSKPEWGALVVPRTVEAFILAEADNLDASLNAIESAYDGSDEYYVSKLNVTFCK